jgi:NTP pyrophosphatase (non-canonical NTP hydrolase)
MSVIKLDLKRADLEVANEVFLELERAISKFPTFNSTHEGYAVLLEEVDELWEEIKQKEKDHPAIREEAIQVAAMAIRFIRDVCDR